MLSSIEPLREPLLVARLLREDILSTPVRPDLRDGVRRRLASSAGAAWSALGAAAELGSAAGFEMVERRALERIAAAAGGTGLRVGPGVPFHGQVAPPAQRAPGLLAEVLEDVNGPKALESWSPVVRAFALHFLLRLVQPFDGDPAIVGCAAEALVLASDGFDARLMRLAPPERVGGPRDGRPDPDAFALERAHGLVEALGETRVALRDASARGVIAGWSVERASGLNARERSVVEWLLDPERSLDFHEYARLHAGRSAPSLRSLQRDWRALREGGWIVEGSDGRWRLAPDALDWGVPGGVASRVVVGGDDA